MADNVMPLHLLPLILRNKASPSHTLVSGHLPICKISSQMGAKNFEALTNPFVGLGLIAYMTYFLSCGGVLVSRLFCQYFSAKT